MARLWRWAALVGLAVVSVVVAVAGAVVARFDLSVVVVELPLGLVFVLVVTAMLFRSALLAFGRAGVAASVAGWLAGIGLLLWPRPGGDVVLANDWLGLLFLLGGVVAGAWNVGRSLATADRGADRVRG